MNLARLNHVLIPSTFAKRERWRRSRWAHLARPLVFLYMRLTPRGRALLLLTVLVGGVGVDVEKMQIYILFSMLAGLCVGSLLRTGPFAMPNVEIEVSCPRRVAVGEPQGFSVLLTNTGQTTQRSVMVEGAFLPWDGTWRDQPQPVEALTPVGTLHSSATVICTAQFQARGEHHLDPFTAAALLPLGLSCGPRIASAPTRFLVVPVTAPVVHVSLPTARRHQPGGVPQASRMGDSMDLLGVRPYRPGDPIRDLHARSWARWGIPVVREYQEEYFNRIGIVVDTDPAHAESRRFEAALSLAAGITARLTMGDALIDLLVVGSEVHTLTLGRSLGFLEQALDLLGCVNPGGAFSAGTMTLALSPFLDRLSGVVFVALTWDEERTRFAASLRARGLACHCIVVGSEDGAHAHDHLAVSVGAIERREPLSL